MFMKVKNQVLLLTLLVSGFVLCPHQRGVAQSDDQPAQQKDAAAPAKTDDASQNADAATKESVTNAPRDRKAVV